MTIRNLYPSIKPTLNLNFAKTKALDPRITFTRASSASYYDADGLLRTAVNNQARFDHDPVTGGSLGLLIEEQRTNLVLRSEEFDDAAWTKTRSSITANAIIAPDGTLTGDKVFVDTQNGWHYIFAQTISVTSGAIYTLSFYAKRAEQEYIQAHLPSGQFGDSNQGNGAVFNLTTGTISAQGANLLAASIISVGNGWYRCSITKAATSTGSALIPITLVNQATFSTSGYTGDGFSGIYVWGAQLEVGAFPTSYIKTEASQVTRLADSASMTGTNFSSWYRIDEGTVYVEAIAKFGSAGTHFVGFDSGNANRWRVGHTGGSAVGYLSVINGSVIFSINRTAALGSYHKSAASYSTSADKNLVVNASVPVSSATLGMPVVNQMTIGSAAGVATRSVHIKKISYYPQRLTNTQLQALTR
jgi:hypothetical protein